MSNIITEVKQSTFFSMIADEAVDCSNKEQMPLILRFIDSNLKIREEFVKYIECDTGTCGEQIAEKIVSESNYWG